MGSMLGSVRDLDGFTIGATDGDIGQVAYESRLHEHYGRPGYWSGLDTERARR